MLAKRSSLATTHILATTDADDCVGDGNDNYTKMIAGDLEASNKDSTKTNSSDGHEGY
jgi:hypothetical protein